MASEKSIYPTKKEPSFKPTVLTGVTSIKTDIIVYVIKMGTITS